MAASPKEKFEAAVKVIQSLPKDASAVKSGAFQPTHGLMLKFYAYFKQANNGPCTSSRPAFWDVVGKAKWDAWSRLGDMSREQAMLNYVEELKKVLGEKYPNGYNKEEIVEAMPHTAMVQDFVQKLDNFYELVDPKEKSPKPNGSIPNGNGDHSSGVEDHSGTEDDLSLRSTEGQGQRLHETAGVGDTYDQCDDVIHNDISTAQTLSQSMQLKSGESGHLNGAVEFTLGGAGSPLGAPPEGLLESPPGGAGSPLEPPPEGVLEYPPGGAAGGVKHGAGSTPESDSEGDEFCDTSDSPQSQRANVEDFEEMYPADQTDHTYHRQPANQPPTSGLPYNVSYSSQYGISHSNSSGLLSPAEGMSEFMPPAVMADRSQSSVFTQRSFADLSNGGWQRSQGKSARGAGEAQPGATSRVPPNSGAESSQQTGVGMLSQATGGRSHLLSAGGGSAGGGGGRQRPPAQPTGSDAADRDGPGPITAGHEQRADAIEHAGSTHSGSESEESQEPRELGQLAGRTIPLVAAQQLTEPDLVLHPPLAVPRSLVDQLRE